MKPGPMIRTFLPVVDMMVLDTGRGQQEAMGCYVLRDEGYI